MSTPRENLIRTLRREGFDNIPVDFELCESQVNEFEARFGHKDYPGYFGQPHRPVEFTISKNFTNGFDLYPREELPEDIEFDVFGVGHSKGSEAAFHMTRMHHPLKGAELEEIKNYPYPELHDEYKNEVKDEIATLHKNGLAAFCKMQMTIWEASWYIRSMEELMMDMMIEDEKASILLDKITGFACSKARAYAECGCDVLSLGDDIGTQSSIMLDTELWKKWLQPRLKKVIDSAKQVKPDILIFYHSCGYIIPFIDDLINTGIEILNPVQPECMSFDEVHDKFGDRLSFWGTIGTQELLPFGTAEDVRKTTISRLQKCGKKGGIVIGPTHLVEPEVPWENIMAIMEGVKAYEESLK